MSTKNKSGYDHLIKLLLIGDSGVGKSNLLTRYNDDGFSQSFLTTIGIDFKIKTILLGGKKIKLQLWDTAGQERFRTITQVYYRGSHGIFIVYDVTDTDSFNHVGNWIRDIERNAGPNVCCVLIGNKSDLISEKVVTTPQGNDLAYKHNMQFFETSAKNGTGVEEAFLALINSTCASFTQIDVTSTFPKPIKEDKCCAIM